MYPEPSSFPGTSDAREAPFLEGREKRLYTAADPSDPVDVEIQRACRSMHPHSFGTGARALKLERVQPSLYRLGDKKLLIHAVEEEGVNVGT